MPTTLDESARRAGAHRWVESSLFALLGGWVPTTPEPEAKLLLDRHSQHHAWRAAQWWDRLPVLADVDREGLTVAPPGALGAAVAAADAAATPAPATPDAAAPAATPDAATPDAPQPATTIARLAVTYRVLAPRQRAAYRRHRADADPVADGATLRTLAIVTADVESDWHEGEAVLQSLVDATPGGAAMAAAAVARLEALWAAPPA